MSFFDDAVNAVKKTVKSVTRPVGNLIKPVTNVVEKAVFKPFINPAVKELEKAVNTVQKLPVIGQVFNIYTGYHYFDGMNKILQGKRIDKSVINAFNKQVKEYKTIAPYAASVVAFVPGVGPGVGASVAAAIALSEGKPLSAIAIEAIKGSIPGGAIAQAAFNVTQSAIAGKSIDKIAISALPIDNSAKAVLEEVIALTKDLAAGKRVDTALMNRIDGATKLLGPELAKAVNIGSAVGMAKTMQNELAKAVSNPAAKSAIAQIGKAASLTDGIVSAARSVNKSPAFQSGFDLGMGFMKGKNVTPAMLETARAQLKPEQKKGYDAALALKIGRTVSMGKKRPATNKTVLLGKKRGTVSLKQKAGYYMTMGVVGGTETQKVGIVKEIAKVPEMRVGAVDAIKTVAANRDSRSLWQLIKQIFGFGTPTK